MLPVIVTLPLAATVTALASSTLLWYLKPSLLLRPLFRFFLYRSGLRLKYFTLGDQHYCIAEKGRKSDDSLTMVCIPGFSATKDMWVPLAQKIPSHIHMVVIELPGHGESSIPDQGQDLSPQKMVQCIHEVLVHLGLTDKPVHMVGTSLGGALTGLYAATYPEDVDRITLMCPAIKTPIETDFMKNSREGDFALIPRTPEEMQRMLDLVMFKSRKLNKQFLQGLLELRMEKTEYYERLYGVLREEQMKTDGHVQDLMAHIKAPVQIVWGKHDQVVHLSGIDFLRDSLTNLERVDLIEDCGHSITMERPGTAIKLLLEFRGESPAAESRPDVPTEPLIANPKL